jgi:hypothetical protein
MRKSQRVGAFRVAHLLALSALLSGSCVVASRAEPAELSVIPFSDSFATNTYGPPTNSSGFIIVNTDGAPTTNGWFGAGSEISNEKTNYAAGVSTNYNYAPDFASTNTYPIPGAHKTQDVNYVMQFQSHKPGAITNNFDVSDYTNNWVDVPVTQYDDWGFPIGTTLVPYPVADAPWETNWLKHYVYVDLMLQPGHLDKEPPAPDSLTGAQMALCVSTGGYLMVMHGLYTAADPTQIGLNSQLRRWTELTNTYVGTSEWIRVTITLDYLSARDNPWFKSDPFGTGLLEDRSLKEHYFQIQINGGEPLTNEYAYDGPYRIEAWTEAHSGLQNQNEFVRGGSWFLCAQGGGSFGPANRYFSGLELQGAGRADDIVVTDQAIVFGWDIDVTSGAGGTITPTGTVRVAHGSAPTFAIVAEGGFKVSDVLVDGSSIGSTNSYTFTDVTDNHSISATFEADAPGWDIDVASVTNGTITPSGTVRVAHGGATNFDIVANSGFTISSVLVDGSPIAITNWYAMSHIFTGVTTNHSISATFATGLNSWMSVHGVSDANSDSNDFDGASAIEEYYAGTEPGDSNSVFKILSIGTTNGSNYMTWYATTNSGFTSGFVIYRSTNLMEGQNGWIPFTNLTATDRSSNGTNMWTWPSSLPGFYRPQIETN